MTQTINIDPEAFARQYKVIKYALDDFRPFVDNFSNRTVSTLETQQSNFISDLKRVLRHASDSTGPDLLATMEDFVQKLDLLAQDFKTTDEALATGARKRH